MAPPGPGAGRRGAPCAATACGRRRRWSHRAGRGSATNHASGPFGASSSGRTTAPAHVSGLRRGGRMPGRWRPRATSSVGRPLDPASATIYETRVDPNQPHRPRGLAAPLDSGPARPSPPAHCGGCSLRANVLEFVGCRRRALASGLQRGRLSDAVHRPGWLACRRPRSALWASWSGSTEIES